MSLSEPLRARNGLLEARCDRTQRYCPGAEIDASLPETQLVTAYPLVASAVTNVIENAIEHNDSQPPEVAIESEEVYHDGTRHVALRVADYRPGIPERELGVLERGYETPLEHTSGLGLWLVQWIVTKSGGEVWFGENDARGSIVFLRFERAETSETPATPTRRAAVAHSS